MARGLQWFLKAEASPQLQRSMQPRIQTLRPQNASSFSFSDTKRRCSADSEVCVSPAAWEQGDSRWGSKVLEFRRYSQPRRSQGDPHMGGSGQEGRGTQGQQESC